MSAKEFDKYLERNIVLKETVKEIHDYRKSILEMLDEMTEGLSISVYENGDIPLTKTELEKLFELGSKIQNLLNTDIEVQ